MFTLHGGKGYNKRGYLSFVSQIPLGDFLLFKQHKEEPLRLFIPESMIRFFGLLPVERNNNGTCSTGTTERTSWNESKIIKICNTN